MKYAVNIRLQTLGIFNSREEAQQFIDENGYFNAYIEERKPIDWNAGPSWIDSEWRWGARAFN